MWTLNDMKPIVSELKQKKANDDVGLVSQFLRHAHGNICIAKLFNHVLFHGEPPYKWHKLFPNTYEKTTAVLATDFWPMASTPVFYKKNAYLVRYHIEDTMEAHQPEVVSGQTVLCGV